jgi:transforming growth factor-beta-induced protein
MRTTLILGITLLLSLASGCESNDSNTDGASGSGSQAGMGSSAGKTGSSVAGADSKAGTSASAGSSAAAGLGGAAAGAGGGGAAGIGRAGTGGAGTGSAGTGSSGPKDIVDTAVAAGSFKQLAAALTKAGLVDALKGAGPFTVFAPTDAAFDALEKAKPGTVAGLSVEQLAAVLKYHVISGAAVKSSELKSGQLAKTLAGPVVAVDLSGDKPKVNDASVTMADIVASNGVIHVIDKVLLPPGDIIEVATAAGKFTKLAKALGDAGLVDALKGAGPFTVFAPTDDAFAKLSAVPTGDALKNVLLYHVINGTVGPLDLKEGGAANTLAGSPVLFALKDGAKVNAAKITVTNVVAKNGVIHIIDTVIVPPSDDIVATAIAAGMFTKLAAALTSAGLVDDLQAKGPFTVFAPTDAAFTMLASTPSGDALKNVLLYHVVSGAVGSGDLKAGSVDTLLTDKKLTIDLASGVKVNAASVTKADILTKNGIIHVIDKVLIPN